MMRIILALHWMDKMIKYNLYYSNKKKKINKLFEG